MSEAQVPIAEQLFGRRLPGNPHTHPDTHPVWLVFTEDTCPICKAGS